MTLRTVAIPSPTTGNDWETAVPGNYLYDVTGITATIVGSADPTVCTDSSGLGNDLTYNPGEVTFGETGFVTPDTMVRVVSQGPITSGDTIDTTFLTGNDLYFNAWTDQIPPSGGSIVFVSFTFPGGNDMLFRIDNNDPVFLTIRLHWQNDDGFLGSVNTDVVRPTAGVGHMYTVRLDVTGLQGQFSVDGANTGPPVAMSGNAPDVSVTGDVVLGGNGPTVFLPACDEIAFGPSNPDDGYVAQLYDARNDFTLYTGLQLAISLAGYYHLDDVTAPAGHQVALEITNGNDLVGSYDSGFPIATPNGPAMYSWIPQLAQSFESAAGTTITVPLPRLILPAGYTVGTRTLDGLGADTWSDITLWWDDAVMLSSTQFDAYRFPPSISLMFVNEVGAQ